MMDESSKHKSKLLALIFIFHCLSKASVIRIFINLLLTVIYMLSLKLPPAFCALQVYLPSSLSVTFVKIKVVFFSLDKGSPSLSQDIFGPGTPLITLQVRLTLSPSCMCLPGPSKRTFGRTMEKNKQLNSIEHFIIFISPSTAEQGLNLIWGGSPRSKLNPFYMPFMSGKGPLSYTSVIQNATLFTHTYIGIMHTTFLFYNHGLSNPLKDL